MILSNLGFVADNSELNQYQYHDNHQQKYRQSAGVTHLEKAETVPVYLT